MFHPGQGLAFRLEPGNNLPAVHTRFDDFQGDGSLDGIELLSSNSPTVPFCGSLLSNVLR
jgi:hypothetical protein